MYHYKRTNPDGTTRTVERYSHSKRVYGAIKITKEEYDAYIAAMPVTPSIPSESVRDKMAALELRVTKLEGG